MNLPTVTMGTVVYNSFEKTEARGQKFLKHLQNIDKSRNASIGYSLCCATALCICNFGFKLLHNGLYMSRC